MSIPKDQAAFTEIKKEFEKFEARGGVMDGDGLTRDRVKEISKWPNRVEQLSILSGQFLSPGANLSAALLGVGGVLTLLRRRRRTVT